MKYVIYCTSNTCDGHVEDILEGNLQDVIEQFYARFDEVSVETETVHEAITNEVSLMPCLVSTQRDEESWWRYTMILWPSEK